jgi:hypothetical protein
MYIFYTHLVFNAIWGILWQSDISCGHLELKAVWYIIWLLVYFVVIWHKFFNFGILHREKSGNPCLKRQKMNKRGLSCFDQKGKDSTRNTIQQT